MLEAAMHRLPCLADADIRMLLTKGFGLTAQGCFILITSYSIHYTKLYDSFDRRRDARPVDHGS